MKQIDQRPFSFKTLKAFFCRRIATMSFLLISLNLQLWNLSCMVIYDDHLILLRPRGLHLMNDYDHFHYGVYSRQSTHTDIVLFS